MNELDFPFGYCTNVHAGPHLAEAKANLLKFAGEVRRQVASSGRLPVGLWLADKAASELTEPGAVEQFRDWLGEHHFLPYTFNGFPQGDFHQAVVKHRVYEPTWFDASRREHTIRLADILDKLLPADSTGSISTLPLGWPKTTWPDKGCSKQQFECAAQNLKLVAKHLALLADRSGREIVLAIEPEPGCILDNAADLIEFFERYLFIGTDGPIARRFLTVCHDICHSAVMFEPQQQVLADYLARGIRIGKVQVSSAIEVPWQESLDQNSREAIEKQLLNLHEPRYLHQTTSANTDGTLAALAEDLPIALNNWLPSDSYPSTNWRIHFHVPIFVEQFGRLRATRRDIGVACQFLEDRRSTTIDGLPWFSGHYEVETYAWPVLPEELQVENLADGIAKELTYFQQLWLATRDQ